MDLSGLSVREILEKLPAPLVPDKLRLKLERQSLEEKQDLFRKAAETLKSALVDYEYQEMSLEMQRERVEALEQKVGE